MKNLKQHIIELEKYRNHLCQMKENVEPDNKDVDCHDQDDQCFEKEVTHKSDHLFDLSTNMIIFQRQEMMKNNNLSNKNIDDLDCDKSDDESNTIDQSSESEAEE